MSLISTFSSLSVRAWQSLQQAIFSKIQIISPALSANEFGSSVEQSGDSNYAVIGASNANKVFMFSRSNDTYTEQTSFTGSTSAQLGTSCDMNYDGTYAIAGGEFASSSAGEARVYTRSGSSWTLEATLTPSDPTAGAGFGADVGLNDAGDIAVVGTSNKNAVYVFTRSGSTWTQQQKLTSSDGAKFGMSVDINGVGDCIVAGSDTLSTAGAVYVFVYSGGSWSQTQKLTASDGVVGDEFGGTLAITPDTSMLVAGAPGATVNSVANAGALYVFTNSGGTWSQQAKLAGSLNDSGRLGDQTGQGVSVDASGTKIIGGAPNAESSAGVAYVFRGQTASWQQTQILRPDTSTSGLTFGTSSAISDDGQYVLVGAPGTGGNVVYAFAN